ncbi:glycosyltransferase family A protein [uncultured Kocuria sp.]|uniref:glycosyltransferase family A protein n=1 Tax=uncultured Kocuria sp. TaxID=259305 RepID=UPI002605A32F|nr:glycosyltransferase family A protein [uncultured Kocuria sp.]
MHIDVLPGPGAPGRLPGAEHELRGLLAELALRGIDARPVGPAGEPVHAAPVRDQWEPGDRALERGPEAGALLLVGLGAGAPADEAQLGHWLGRSRAAADAGRPVVVSGLDLGAGPVPEETVRRLLSIASVVGLRDEASLAVARRLCPEHPGLRVGRQDALLLPVPAAPAPAPEGDSATRRPGELDGPAERRREQEEPAAPPRIVAAVARPAGPFPPEQVAPVLASVLDALVHRTGGTVTLLACGGACADEEFAAEVAALLRDDVRRTLPDEGGAGAAALRADWVLTTCPRGAALGLAARAVVLPVAPDKYSLDSMNAVLACWGLGDGVVPLAALLTPGDVAWDTPAAVQQWATEAVEHRGAVRAALADAEPAVRAAAARWWDDVAGALRGGAPQSAPVAAVPPRGVGAPVVRALRRRYTVPVVPPERPTVAVVLRHRDGPAGLRRAVDDLLAQTFTDWRLVVVNDGGDPAEVDEALAPRRDELAGRATVLHHRRALGPAVAANRGLGAVDSELVVRHEGTDPWPPTLLQRAVAHLEDPLVTDDGVVVQAEGTPGGVEVGPSRRPGRELVRPDRDVLTLTDVLDGDRTAVDRPFLYRRAVHGVLGDYDETLGAAEGWEFTLRFLETFTVGLLPARPPAAQERAEGPSAARGELTVRDRYLRQWSAENGVGLPLYLRRAAAEEAGALHRRLDAAEELAHELLDVVRAQSRQIERLEQVVAERGFIAFWRRVWRSLRGG